MRDPASRTAPRRRAASAAGSSRVTDRDRELLAFVAAHRIVLAAHVQALLRVGERFAYRRLGALVVGGFLQHTRVLHGQPGWYQITRPGLAVIGSDLPPPRIDLRCYQHDIGVAWIWIAAARGALGDVDRVVSEREMRSRDAARSAARSVAARSDGASEIGADREPRYGVRLGGVGRGGLIRLHYPDLLLIGPGEQRLAVELELSAKGRRRLEGILAGYGAEPAVARVLYLAEKHVIRREVRSTAARLGISELVNVQRFAWPASGRAVAEGGAARARGATGRAVAEGGAVRARGATGRAPAAAR